MVRQATFVYYCVLNVRSIYRILAEMVLYLLKMYFYVSLLYAVITKAMRICPFCFVHVLSIVSFSSFKSLTTLVFLLLWGDLIYNVCISICLAQTNSLQIRQICICDWCSVIFLTRCKALRCIARNEQFSFSVTLKHSCASLLWFFQL